MGSDASPDSDLIAKIYDSVCEPVLLAEVLPRIAGDIGCDALYFNCFRVLEHDGGRAVGIGDGTPDGSNRDFAENYLASDLRVPRLERAPPGLLLDDRQLISPAEERDSAFHIEFLPRYDLRYLLHAKLSSSPSVSSMVTCGQARGRGEFTERQRRLIAGYVTHFERAASLYLRLTDIQGRAALMSAAFDGLPLAGMVLDASGRLLFANARATDWLARGDGVALDKGRIAPRDSRAARLLERAIGQAYLPLRHHADQDNAASVIPIRRPSARPDYQIEVRPLPLRSAFRREAPAAAVLVFVIDPEARADRRARMLHTLYGLTPAETALALAVGSGVSLNDYAARRGVTVGTVRYQMKQVLAKTDCRRQGDLIRLLR
jgi:DNA-binding CsgD family transcriptional regulator